MQHIVVEFVLEINMLSAITRHLLKHTSINSKEIGTYTGF